MKILEKREKSWVTIPFSNSEVPDAGLEDLSSQAIVDVLTKEILAAANETTAANSVLGDLIIDLDSLEVQGKDISIGHWSEMKQIPVGIA